MASEPSIAEFFQELPRNWKAVCRAIISYLLIGIFGVAILSVVTTLYKVAIAQNTMSQAELLYSADKPGEALDQLTQIEPWAVPYPALEYRLTWDAVRCNIKMGDFKSATRMAHELASRYGNLKIPRGPTHMLRRLAESFIQKPDIGPPLSEWCGYEVMRSELKALGGHDDLLREIEKEMPPQYQTTPIQQPSNGHAPPPDVKPVPPAANQAVDWKPAEDASAVNPGAPPVEISHYDLALKHIGQQDWDKALRQCEVALSSTPNDLRMTSLKNMAKCRGKGWAAVKNANAKAHSDAGAVPYKIEAGALVDILEVKQDHDGVMAVCNVVNEGPEPFKILIPLRDLDISTGSLSQAGEQFKKLKIRQAQLQAQLQALADKRDSMNPNSKEYAAARTAWDDFRAKDADLRAKEETSKDDDRSKYLDELQKMKFAKNRLEQTYKTAKKKYKEWEDAHPVIPEDLAEISKLEYNLASVHTQVRQMEPEQ